VETTPAPVQAEPAPAPRRASHAYAAAHATQRDRDSAAPHSTSRAGGGSDDTSPRAGIPSQPKRKDRSAHSERWPVDRRCRSTQASACARTRIRLATSSPPRSRNAVQGSNGAVIPPGASAIVEITTLKRSERANDNIEVGLRVESITFNGKTYPVTVGSELRTGRASAR
jgi:hypothetical protein